MSQIDLRIHGKPDDVAEFEQLLDALRMFLQTGSVSPTMRCHKGRMQILETSKFYPNQRGSQLGRKYLKVEF
jgi:hypothetical protein